MKEFEKLLKKESRPFSNFTSKDEYLEAMVEDLSDWLNFLYNLQDDVKLSTNNFFERLEDGVILCKHAHVIQSLAEVYISSPGYQGRTLPIKIANRAIKVPMWPPSYTNVDSTKKVSSFSKRDNVSNFIGWCRNCNIPTSLTFETDDLVMLKNPRSVVIALLEVSRIGKIFGMEVPDIIQLEQDIDDEMKDASKYSENIMIRLDSPVDGSTDCTDHNEQNEEVLNESLESKPYSVSEEQSVQFNNSSLEVPDLLGYQDDIVAVGLQGRRSSAILSRRGISPICDNLKNAVVPSESITKNELVGQFLSLNGDISTNSMRKSQSVYFNVDGLPEVRKTDNSDNESNFSQGSLSKFIMPRYKTQRPVGRVKIYDTIDKSNFVKVKKNREKVDLRSLDDRVREILSQCTCEQLFPMKRISEGRYTWGDNRSQIFVRILRSHVMVRVGGGWDTLGDFLSKHDTCRKGKCENFKFCLPSLNKTSPSTITPVTLQLKPNNTCPSSIFEQGMLTVTKTGSRTNSIDIGGQIEDERLVSDGSDVREAIIDGNQSTTMHNNKNNNNDVSDGAQKVSRRNESLPDMCNNAMTTNNNTVKLRTRTVNDNRDLGQCVSSVSNLNERPLSLNRGARDRPQSAIKDKTSGSSSTKIPRFISPKEK